MFLYFHMISRNLFKKKILFLLISHLVFFEIYFSKSENETFLPTPKLSKNIEYSENNHFIINNNLAQYSSYIIIQKENNKSTHQIETLLLKSTKYEKIPKKIDYLCILKYTKDQRDENIEIKPTKFYLFNHNETVKLSFTLHLNSFKTFQDDPNNFDIQKIVCAVILINDFDKNLKTLSINPITSNTTHQLPLVFPYFYIRYQRPMLIYAQIPRLPSVGLCIQQVYNISSPLQLKNWIDYHLYIGIGEIRFYDAIANKLLTKFIQENYKNNQKITVTPYKKHNIFDNIYDQFKHLNLPNALKEKLYNSHRFRLNREFFTRADDLTTNDCFTVLRYKHEFIAHYDLDEIIFPRNFDNIKDFYGKKANYNCKNSIEICSINPFTFKNSQNQNQNYIYEYINSLIESERKGRDREKLRSIDFRRTLMIKPNDIVETRILKDLKNIITKVDSNLSISYPLDLFIPLALRKKVGYKFLIQKEDIDYIKYLYKTYFDLIPCSYNEQLKDSINTHKMFDDNFFRLFYFMTPYDTKQKNYKKIHYYKNVYSIFTHWASDFEEDSWTLIPSPNEGHLIHHFRNSWKFRPDISTDSIRLLNIDYEYLFFLLKHYSSFC